MTAEKKNPLAQQEPYRGVELGPGLGTQLLGLLLGLLRAARDLAADFCGCLVHVACGESAPGGLKALEGHRGPSGAVGGGAKLGERPLTLELLLGDRRIAARLVEVVAHAAGDGKAGIERHP